MNSITEFLITLFESLGLYSTQNGLSEHLRGLDLTCNDYTRQSIYSMVFLCLFCINTIIVVNYYYGIFNRIPCNTFFKWSINILAGAIILFLIAFLYANNDMTTGNICNQLSVATSDCIGFGVTSAIYSIIWSCILSFIIKWKSTVNRKIPF